MPRGTRFGIRMDADGLLAAGVPGVQLTWMDARVGDRVITPRIGKPVEIQALWLNALSAASRLEPQLARRLRARPRALSASGSGTRNSDVWPTWSTSITCRARATTRFGRTRFLPSADLPVALLDGERARRIVDAVEQRLLTPVGLRSLAPGEPGYAPRYEGDSSARDAVYHQGTVWPWLIGPFVEAWVRVRGNTHAARRDARARFMEPLLRPVQSAGLGHRLGNCRCRGAI